MPIALRRMRRDRDGAVAGNATRRRGVQVLRGLIRMPNRFGPGPELQQHYHLEGYANEQLMIEITTPENRQCRHQTGWERQKTPVIGPHMSKLDSPHDAPGMVVRITRSGGPPAQRKYTATMTQRRRSAGHHL